MPRFDYETHLEALERDSPEWPESTRRLSQVRITIEFKSASALRRAFGISRLNLDVVDYPGEWLIDLPLLDMSYEQWCAEAVEQAAAPRRQAHSKAWREFLSTIDADGPKDERIALRGATLFAAYLKAARADDHVLHTTGPGRFLLPGDLEGSPLLTFCPLALGTKPSYARSSLAAMMARRFESYKSHVVQPFFRDHFSRLDRQIVLVDVLGPLNEGGDAVVDLQRALEAILRVFRAGASNWLSALFVRRIDKLLFAATKADHIHSSSHDRLEAILRVITDRAMGRAAEAGANVGVQALAALRATRETDAKVGNEWLPCIVGVPMPGERIGGKVFDGKTEAAVFPGDLPVDPLNALKPDAAPAGFAFRPLPAATADASGSRRRSAAPAAHPARPCPRFSAVRLARMMIEKFATISGQGSGEFLNLNRTSEHMASSAPCDSEVRYWHLRQALANFGIGALV